MLKNIEVVVAGHICIDLTPKILIKNKKRIEEIFAPGKVLTVGECVISRGGVVSNTGLALVKLGISTGLIGKIGDDLFGDMIYNIFKSYNSSDMLLKAEGEETSYTIVLAPSGIDRIFLHNPGANNSYSSEDIDFEKIKNAKIFHFGYPVYMKKIYENNGKELERIFKLAKEYNFTTSLDTAFPDPEGESGKLDWKKILEKIAPYLDIFLPSAEEILFFLDKVTFFKKREKSQKQNMDPVDLFTLEECITLTSQLIEMGIGIAGLKLGHRGLYIRTGSKERLEKFGKVKPSDYENWADREIFEPSFKVEKVVSATGAGDSCIAGFLASFLKGKSFEFSAKFATACGALNVLSVDAISGLKSFEETEKLMKNWEKNK